MSRLIVFRLQSLLFAAVAVLALSSPSLAVGFVTFTSSTGTVVNVVDGDVASGQPTYRPCEKQGGKRVLPCQPEPVLRGACAEVRSWSVAAVPSFGSDRQTPVRSPATDPPPPRA